MRRKYIKEHQASPDNVRLHVLYQDAKHELELLLKLRDIINYLVGYKNKYEKLSKHIAKAKEFLDDR